MSNLGNSGPEVLVVGAGINGLITAYCLCKGGARVTLCDRGPIPNPDSASHGAHRLIHPWVGTGTCAQAKEILTAAQLWQQLLQDIGCDGFQRCGVLVASGSQDGAKTNHLELTPAQAEHQLAGAGTQAHRLWFPTFGALLANRILVDLVAYLKNNGVMIYPQSELGNINAHTGWAQIGCQDGRLFDHIVLATGWRSRNVHSLPELSPSLQQFRPWRCYVLYVPAKAIPERLTPKSAWAGFMGHDLWGMPALCGHDAKFGHGGLSHPANDPAPTAQQIRAAFVEAYRQADHGYHFLEHGRIATNIWAECPGPNRVVSQGKCSLITSDFGGGFKTAPLVGREICEKLLASKPHKESTPKKRPTRA
ncbi:MAG: FAD-dependent oxidoreductase [Pseudoruegeria sp.]